MITAGMCAVCKPTTGPVPFGVEFKGETNKTVSQDKWAPITYQEAVKNNVSWVACNNINPVCPVGVDDKYVVSWNYRAVKIPAFFLAALRIQQPPDGNLCEFDDEATREESGA